MRMAKKRFEFIEDYASKQGFKVKKGEVLSAYYSEASSNPRWMFDWYEGIDNKKVEAGEGVFSIFDSELKTYAKETTNPVKRIEPSEDKGQYVPDSDYKKDETKEDKKPFFKRPIGYVVIGLSVVALGVGTYFLLKKK